MQKNMRQSSRPLDDGVYEIIYSDWLIVMSRSHQENEENRRRLRWRTRRGLLENDLILTRFMDAHEQTLTDNEVSALTLLLDLSDNVLLDLFLSRTALESEIDTPDVQHLLTRIRQFTNVA
jgi:antitoxin CptB